MKQLWTPITKPIKSNVQQGLDTATTKVQAAVKQGVAAQSSPAAVKKAVTQKVTQAVDAQVKAGAIPQAAAATVIEQQVAAALPAAEVQAQAAAAKALPGATTKALATTATKAHASVVNGKLAVDWSNASERRYYVGQIVPTIVKQIHKGSSKSTSSASSGSDTSFLKGADKRLSKPFLTGFNVSAVQIYWVGLIVLLVAFVLSLFFRVPPLRQRSALQEQADRAADAKDKLDVEAGDAAALSGSLVGPTPESRETVGSRP
jgi:hypothetical protein